MSVIKPPSDVYCAASPVQNAGRGVFAKEPIKKDHVIEIAPVVVVPEDQAAALKKTNLINYYFLWGSDGAVAIALGFGSLYNHSYEPNAKYEKVIGEEVIRFAALRDIAAHEEITTNYNGDPNDKSPLWIAEILPAIDD